MVREIGGPGIDPARSDALRDALKSAEVGKSTQSSQAESTDGVEVSGELTDLISRIKQSDSVRKDKVHEVMQKLQNGTLVTPQSIGEAAKQMLDGGI